MKRLILYIVGILIIILENTVTNYIDVFGVSLNILLIYMTIISLYIDELEIGIVASILGVIKDITVGAMFGINAITLFIISFSISYLRKKIYKENYITILVLVFITSIVDSVINMILVRTLYIVDTSSIMLYRGFIVYPIINCIISIFMYKLSKEYISRLKES